MKELWKRLKKFDLEGVISLILQWSGVGDYTKKVEFAAHIFAGLWFSSLCVGMLIGWAIYALFSEFYQDGHWKVFIGKDPEWRDLCWDLGSKLFGPIVYGIYYIV